MPQLAGNGGCDIFTTTVTWAIFLVLLYWLYVHRSLLTGSPEYVEVFKYSSRNPFLPNLSKNGH
jgi:hypothetical protein